ncbi:uncharacterized protein LOC132750044 [Ruditapes philippinarum]|uniref:uncharacterized protein LOC132750044 n=1 Tax=Ruditapes philippinarum TaxID=129788 RepID=UPI00295AE683|nr:uncharacterized protein LOC132750044 [Ruditapes philippinarum]
MRVNLKRCVILILVILSSILWVLFENEPQLDDDSTSIKDMRKGVSKFILRNSDKNPEMSQVKIPIEKSPPVLLAGRMSVKCQDYLPTLRKRTQNIPITTNAHYNLFYCPMCKLASTYWTRFFKMLDMYNDTSILSPYDIPISIAKPTGERLQITVGTSGTPYDNYFKFMFVRDPYARILSAYVDKIFAPNPIYWEIWSKLLRKLKIDSRHTKTKCRSHFTFDEYIQSIIFNNKLHANFGTTDCHEASYVKTCHPCELKMNFVGKLEQFATDSYFLYEKLNLSRAIETITKQGKQLADEDALQDTVTSPFEWKDTIKSCIPWLEALKRIWRKLQVRGVIGKEELPLTAELAENISVQEFINLVLTTKEKTPYSERKKQRTEALIEIYSSVKPELLEQLKHIYKHDFDFFEYDNNPSTIFNVSIKDIQYYGYLDT